MWDWLDSAVSDVSDIFSGSSDASSAADGPVSSIASEAGGVDNIDGPLASATSGELAAQSPLAAAELNNPDGLLGGGNPADFNANSSSWASLASGAASGLKSTAGLLTSGSKTAASPGFITRQTPLQGEARAMGYEQGKAPAPGQAVTSVDPRQINQYWYNLMKQFAYTGNK